MSLQQKLSDLTAENIAALPEKSVAVMRDETQRSIRQDRRPIGRRSDITPVSVAHCI
jgi:hypothetical protein